MRSRLSTSGLLAKSASRAQSTSLSAILGYKSKFRGQRIAFGFQPGSGREEMCRKLVERHGGVVEELYLGSRKAHDELRSTMGENVRLRGFRTRLEIDMSRSSPLRGSIWGVRLMERIRKHDSSTNVFVPDLYFPCHAEELRTEYGFYVVWCQPPANARYSGLSPGGIEQVTSPYHWDGVIDLQDARDERQDERAREYKGHFPE